MCAETPVWETKLIDDKLCLIRFMDILGYKVLMPTASKTKNSIIWSIEYATIIWADQEHMLIIDAVLLLV